MDTVIPLFKVRMPPASKLMPELERVLYSGMVTEGVDTSRFESKVRQFLGNPYGVATNSCTSALYMALKQLGASPDTEVITPSMTCVATNAAVAMTGTKIVWADVDPLTGMLDVDDVLDKVTDKTCAVVCVHWGGDLGPILDLRSQLPGYIEVVNDAAQAFGAIDNFDRKLGAPEHGYTCFSFQAIKHITTTDGGFLAVTNQDVSDFMDRIEFFGIDRNNFRDSRGEICWHCDIPVIGYKMHMNNVLATIGCVQMDDIDEILSYNRRNGLIYDKLFKEVPEVTLMERTGTSAFWVYTLLAKNVDVRNAIIDKLAANGIHASAMHAPNHIYSGFNHLVDKDLELPGTIEFANRHICLPCGWWVEERDVHDIVDMCKGVL